MREKFDSFLKINKIVAILRGVEPDKVLSVAEALYNGGIRLLEITFRQNAPESFVETTTAIKQLSQHFDGKMLIGAGTVLTVEQLEMAHEAGAIFMIAPDTNVNVIKRAKELGMIVVPGAMTPSEVMTAYNSGADYVKIFPAADLGTSYIKAIRGPISHIPMMAVGGVDVSNAADFLKVGICALGVGGTLVDKKAIAAGEYEKLTAVAKELVKATAI